MKYLGTRNKQYDPVVTQDISGKQDKSTLEQDVAAKGFTKNTGTYSKPSGGIPKTDLSDSVQVSLGKADTALQTAPVTSVNGKTGTVSLGAGDVGAISTSNGAVGSSNLADNIPYTKFGLSADQVRHFYAGTTEPGASSAATGLFISCIRSWVRLWHGQRQRRSCRLEALGNRKRAFLE